MATIIFKKIIARTTVVPAARSQKANSAGLFLIKFPGSSSAPPLAPVRASEREDQQFPINSTG